MTDPLSKYRKSDKSLNPSKVFQAYLVIDSNNQPFVLCVLTDDGWIEISPVIPSLMAELVAMFGELKQHSLQNIVQFKNDNESRIETVKAFIKAFAENTPTAKP